MRSSTSSSELRAALVWFAAAFVLSSVGVAAAWRLPSLRGHVVVDSLAPPQTADHYRVSDTSLTGEHVFLHELYPVREPLEAADIVIFGNSRTLVAMPDRLLEPFFERRDLRHYHLGFGAGTDAFAHEILDRYDLSAKWVVVDADQFFTGTLSKFAVRALETSRREALQMRFELAGASGTRRWLHRLLPHPVGRDLEGSVWLVYRSIAQGGWEATASVRRRPTGVDVQRPPYPPVRGRVALARAFADRIERSGGRLILTYVPWRIDLRERARRLAEQLGVPGVFPEPPELQTIEGSHLDRASVDRFARDFLAELEPLLP